MTITLSEKTGDNIQQDGSRRITFKFTFHTGEVLDRSFLAPSGYDDTAGLAAMVPIVEDHMIELECMKLITQAEEGGTDILDAAPVHPETISLANRKKNLAKKALRYIWNNKDIKLARIILYGVWYYLKYESGFTAQQIADYLDISLAVLQKINSRFQFIHDNLSALDADDSYLIEGEE